MVPFYSLTSQAYGSAFAPVQWAHQETLKAFERLTRFQLVIARDFFEYNFAGLQAIVSARTPVQYFAKQGELNLGIVRAVTTDTQKFLKESSEVAQKFAEVVRHSTEDFAASTERAASSGLKQATEAAEEFTRQVKRQTEEGEEFMRNTQRAHTNSEEGHEPQESQQEAEEEPQEEEEAAPPPRRGSRASTSGTRRAKGSRREHH